MQPLHAKAAKLKETAYRTTRKSHNLNLLRSNGLDTRAQRVMANMYHSNSYLVSRGLNVGHFATQELPEGENSLAAWTTFMTLGVGHRGNEY